MKILKKEILADHEGTRLVRMELHSPLIAKKASAGQFVVLMADEKGERIPLTIVEADREKGSIAIIFQEVGHTTKLLGKMEAGKSLYSLTGPLGHATEIRKFGKVILVGGGVGIAEIYPVARALKASGNRVVTILGARTKALLILEKELKETSDEIYITTDDGSYGLKGFTTSVLEGLLSKGNYDLVYSVGPIPMMKNSSSVTRRFNVRTLVSLNALMVDATGMCGCCRVAVGGKVKFSCVDGPEFDAHQVDWEELDKRNRVYTDKEKHICKLNNLK
ncbi:MAG: sulfide/dihydroorotate dehydrogenase-like FAD/NAD-binding protein [Candidatus Omnitrophica bacterium]|nr:sulfide/dihydroorotate dehydrogenase-like FAD/NAD-binding protein [Candidatus Omnitrophota bacterium]